MKKALAFALCALMLPSFAYATAFPSAAPSIADEATPTPAPQTEADLLEAALQEGVSDEDLPVDDEAAVAAADEAQSDLPSVAGMTPLYTTKIKTLTSTGTGVTIRTRQDTDSEGLGMVPVGEVVTIYEVYPSFVKIEYNGVAGYILRTCIDENCSVIDPEHTPPYGVTMMKYVATAAQRTEVYKQKDQTGEFFPIVVGQGSKIAIVDFEDGFAKVIYWRSYGYIPAQRLTDLKVVSATDTPMSQDTPISAFCSFFAYNTGSEANNGRVKNIIRSCELMTRTLQPGELLDFNAQIGPYKKSNGYFPAPVLIDGGSQLGSGGGTCQSSSTLYNTVRQLPGITVVYRRPHGPGSARYLPQHCDAAVGNAKLNFIIRNDYEFPVRIVAESTGEGTLMIQIFKGD